MVAISWTKEGAGRTGGKQIDNQPDHIGGSWGGPRLHPLQLLLPDCVRFSCSSPIASAACSLIASASAAAPDYVHFRACSPIVSASAAAPGLRPFQLPSRVLEGSNPSTSIRRVRGSVYLVRRSHIIITPTSHTHTHKHTVKIL